MGEKWHCFVLHILWQGISSRNLEKVQFGAKWNALFNNVWAYIAMLGITTGFIKSWYLQSARVGVTLGAHSVTAHAYMYGGWRRTCDSLSFVLSETDNLPCESLRHTVDAQVCYVITFCQHCVAYVYALSAIMTSKTPACDMERDSDTSNWRQTSRLDRKEVAIRKTWSFPFPSC